MTRLRILSDDEFNKLYKKPNILEEERYHIFELDQNDHNYLNTLNNIENAVIICTYFPNTLVHV